MLSGTPSRLIVSPGQAMHPGSTHRCGHYRSYQHYTNVNILDVSRRTPHQTTAAS